MIKKWTRIWGRIPIPREKGTYRRQEWIDGGVIGRHFMKEATGTLNLKIERLRQQLSVLQQQQELGRTYPDFLIVLQRKFMEIERDRRQLVQMREELGGYAVQNTEQGIISGEQRYGTESVYAVD